MKKWVFINRNKLKEAQCLAYSEAHLTAYMDGKFRNKYYLFSKTIVN